jgi:DHA3 family tetracycline resistance protein-like MFS transporter
MFGQVDAIGQVVGGPVVAGIAAISSAVTSLVTSGMLLVPALFFVSRANSQSVNEAEAETDPIPAG